MVSRLPLIKSLTLMITETGTNIEMCLSHGLLYLDSETKENKAIWTLQISKMREKLDIIDQSPVEIRKKGFTILYEN